MFARAFGHSDRVEEVIDLLENGELRRVDVGIVNDDELFLSHRSYGPLQQIQETVEKGRGQPMSRMARHLAYYAMAKRFLITARPPSIRVEVDDTLVADGASLVTIANVETYRGFLSLTPTASPIDGLFDIFVVPHASRLALNARLLLLLLKAPGRWNGVMRCRGRRVVVTMNQRRREELKAVRRALRLLVPRGSIERPTHPSTGGSPGQADAHAGERRSPRQALDRIATSVRRPTTIQTAWRPRRTRVKASPALAVKPRAAKAAEFAPSSAPTLAGTRNAAKRTAEPKASMTTAVRNGTGRASTTSIRYASSAPRSQPQK
jgi:hypothetical protein